MRLIDADELELDTEWSEYYDGYMSYSQSQIKGAVEVQAIPIPEDATNGDMIKALFPNFPAQLTESISINFCDEYGSGNDIVLYRDWWNAPYKKEVKE